MYLSIFRRKYFGVMLLGFFVLAACATYLIVSWRASGFGFPLDDAWIHQVYARNLAQNHAWEFIPGKPSAGSTAPLWTFLLALESWGKAPPYVWTFGLGILSLFALAVAGNWYAKYSLNWKANLPFAGIFLVLEWHLCWAALSGMETIFYAGIILWLFVLIAIPNPRWLVLGLVVGIAVWIRPDAITLLGPLGWILLLSKLTLKEKFTRSSQVALGLMMGLIPYFIFTFLISGSLLPNTFYAKQAEYVSLLATPFTSRFLSLLGQPFIGAGIVLLPGVVWKIWISIRNRQIAIQAAWLWWLGFTALYTLRLPVVYQYGRYLIPAMPVIWLVGLGGSLDLFKKLAEVKKVGFILRSVWIISFMLILVGFWGFGAFRYAQDVRVINEEMVASAKWIAENTPSNALIATHDIGAIGYFSHRNLIDLAGLVSPEVIPFIRDEVRLAKYLDQQKADYLVGFPSWYPQLIRDKPIVYSTNGKAALEQGYENMQVYLWRVK